VVRLKDKSSKLVIFLIWGFYLGILSLAIYSTVLSLHIAQHYHWHFRGAPGLAKFVILSLLVALSAIVSLLLIFKVLIVFLGRFIFPFVGIPLSTVCNVHRLVNSLFPLELTDSESIPDLEEYVEHIRLLSALGRYQKAYTLGTTALSMLCTISVASLTGRRAILIRTLKDFLQSESQDNNCDDNQYMNTDSEIVRLVLELDRDKLLTEIFCGSYFTDRSTLSIFLLSIGNLQFRRGRIDGALVSTILAEVSCQPHSIVWCQARCLRCRILHRSGKVHEASSLLIKTSPDILPLPGNTVFKLERALLFLGVGDLNASANEVAFLPDTNTDDTTLVDQYRVLAYIHICRGESSKAIDNLSKALKFSIVGSEEFCSLTEEIGVEYIKSAFAMQKMQTITNPLQRTSKRFDYYSQYEKESTLNPSLRTIPHDMRSAISSRVYEGFINKTYSNLDVSAWRIFNRYIIGYLKIFQASQIRKLLESDVKHFWSLLDVAESVIGHVKSDLICSLATVSMEYRPPWVSAIHESRIYKSIGKYDRAAICACRGLSILEYYAISLAKYLDTANIGISIYDLSREAIHSFMLSGTQDDIAKALDIYERALNWNFQIEEQAPSSANTLQKSVDCKLYVRCVLCDLCSFLFLTNAEGHSIKQLPDRQTINTLASRLLSIITLDTSTEQEVADECRLFGHLIFENCDADLINKELVFIADPDLASIPWSALRFDSSDEPIIFRSSIAIVPSVQYIQVKSITFKTDYVYRMTIFADPILSNVGIPDLTYALREANVIDKALKSTAVSRKLGVAANWRALQQAAIDSQIIHFATHKTIDGSGLSCILLASEEGQPWHAVSSNQIKSLKFSAELVVLNLCESGNGSYLGGEGIADLPRAFLTAGAKRVIATNWPVEDLPAMRLMETFYTELYAMSEADPVKALQIAQVRIAQEPAWSSPRFWAAYYLIGKPDAFQLCGQ